MRNGGGTAAILSWVQLPSPSAPVVPPFRQGDLADCRRLWAELTQTHRDLYGDPEIGGADPGSAFDGYVAEAGEEGILVAEVDGQVVGLAGLLVHDGGRGELEPVVVTEALRGQGISGRLTDAVIAAARARGLRRLTVRPVGRNAAAIHFFHGAGFDVLGRLDLQLELQADRIDRVPGPDLAQRRFRV
jgi:N-acetylglutamate synthase-like GNAT family acetyltransferase